MKLISILSIIVLTYFLVSCASDNIIIQPRKISWSNAEKIVIDSVYVSKVEDKRTPVTKTLGTCYTGMFNSPTPIIFNQNLSEYLKENFNKLLSRSSDTTISIPVTIELNKMNLGEEHGFISESTFSKYSYTFSYPKGDAVKKVVITDSVEIPSGNDANVLVPLAFYNGIKKAAEVFSYYYKANPGSNNSGISSEEYNLSVVSSVSETSHSGNSIDTIRVINKTKKRSMLSFGYFNEGSLIDGGFNIGYFTLFNKEGSHFEIGGGPEINFYDIKPHADLTASTFMSYNFPIIARYYFQDKPQNFFLSGILKISGGTETITYGGGSQDVNFFFGPTFELGLGYQLGQYIDIMVCVHQIYNWGSRVLPNNFGLNFNAHISFGYK